MVDRNYIFLVLPSRQRRCLRRIAKPSRRQFVLPTSTGRALRFFNLPHEVFHSSFLQHAVNFLDFCTV
jgi:hypothetical protein